MNNRRQRLVSDFLKRPSGAVSLAIALSLLLHTVLLFGPKLVVPVPVEVLLPPLMAKLEPLPVIKPVVQPKPKAKAKPRRALKPKPVAAPVAQTAVPAEVQDEKPETDVQSGEDAPPVNPPEPADKIDDAPALHAPPLPKHAQLTFIVYKGTSFQIGLARHTLKINDEKKYTLQANVNTTGIASIFKTFALNQQSCGTADAQGLQPDEFVEDKVTSGGKQTLTAKFDWQSRQLAFSNGNNTALPEQAQDILSFLYQFSQMPLDHTLTMHISNGRKLESYQMEVGQEEEMMTPLGKLRALPLRKINAPGEEGLEIWLGLEYRLLPVKIRQIEKNGEIGGQMVISDIRVSEE